MGTTSTAGATGTLGTKGIGAGGKGGGIGISRALRVAERVRTGELVFAPEDEEVTDGLRLADRDLRTWLGLVGIAPDAVVLGVRTGVGFGGILNAERTNRKRGSRHFGR
jgi:hypothetical protein